MRRRRRRYQGIVGAVGLPGSGKTYWLAQQAAKARSQGVPLYSNAGFDIEGAEQIGSFRELAALRGPATVVWDELPLYFSAREWSKFPPGLFYKFTQIRKDSIQLFYTGINERMIDSNLRNLTFWFWKCRSITSRLVHRQLFDAGSFLSEATSKRKPFRSELVVIRNSIASTYDTMGRVMVQADVAESYGRLDGAAFVLPEWARAEKQEADEAEAGGSL